MSSGSSSSGHGSGRSKLIRQLLESSKKVTSSSSSGGNEHDSGIVGTSGLEASPSSGSRAVSGRGRIYKEISSSSSSSELQTSALGRTPSTSTSGAIPRGRGQLLSTLQATSSTASSSQSSLTSHGKSSMLKKLLKHESTILEHPTTDVITRGVEMLSTKDTIIEEKEEVEEKAVIKRGTKGTEVPVICNYIRIRCDQNKGVFEYEVRFDPPVDARNSRFRYLNEHTKVLGGTKTFDGVTLYLPIQLPEKITKLHSTNQVDNSSIEIIIIYKRRKPLKECIHMYNVLFDRIMKTLNYVRFDRKQYDPTAPKIIPQHRLEVWPGYVTAVDEYEGGIMLCCDVSHRMLCQNTVLDTLQEIYQSNRGNENGYQDMAKKALLGSVVLTRYNNKTYRIDDIDFKSNPQATFNTKNGDISFIQYYRTQYNININDVKQPLLTSIKKLRVAGQEEQQELTFCLIPEICYLTGLRDDIRANTKVMREIASFMRVSPNQRIAALQKFYDNINNCKEAREILENWGLSLESQPLKLKARQLDCEAVYFGNRKEISVGPGANFANKAASTQLIETVDIMNWLFIHTKGDTRYANTFIEYLEINSAPMGITVRKPRVHVLNSDRTQDYVTALRNEIKRDTQIVVILCPTSRDDRYAAIKKICCAEIPIPSQVINSKTLSNNAKNRSIVQKIALQMNCKLGGSLWSVKIPFRNVMICGIDSYHDAGQKGNSVAAFVASLNGIYTKWYSRAIIQNKKEEIVNGLCACLGFALKAYRNCNPELPEKIIIIRDGVGDGQLNLVRDYEVPQFQAACSAIQEGYSPMLTFIVVQKRINTRIFKIKDSRNTENPEPGLVLDHTVTRKYLYDFFLVPQSVREGTVTPTHYVVVYDSADFSPDIIQRLCYKLCFLYYNFPGAVKVPACCQYAHKMAYLIGQNVKKQNAETLCDKLFYL